MPISKVKIGSFLTERSGRLKPSVAAKLNLMRVDKIDFSGKIFISDKPTNTDMILVKKGDLLISGINVEKGAIAVYEGKDDILASIHYSSYHFDKNKIDIEYLKWFLKSESFKNLLKENAGGGIKTELKAKHLLPLEIVLPNILKQKEIVKVIENDHLKVETIGLEITKQQSYIEKLRQAILQDAIQGKIVPQNSKDEPASELLKKIGAEKGRLISQGKLKKEKPLPPITKEEIPFELPIGWSWSRLGNVVDLITKGSSPTWQGVSYIDREEVLFITSENVDSYKLILDKRKYVESKFNEIESRSILQRGDFLMNIVGGSIGRTAIFDLDEVANINQAVCLIRKSTKFINSEYLLHFFNSPLCISYMFDKQVDNARPNLSMGNISKFLIPVPPLFEQQKIIAKVNQLNEYCHKLEENAVLCEKQANKLSQAILREAFNHN